MLFEAFAVQEEIAQAVSSALEVRLSSGEARRLERTGTRNARALEKYLRARKLRFPALDEHVRLARDLLKEAVVLDAKFAEAHAALADADFSLLQWHVLDERTESSPRGAHRERGGAAARSRAGGGSRRTGEPPHARWKIRRGGGGVPPRHRAQPGPCQAWYFQGRFLLAAGRFP